MQKGYPYKKKKKEKTGEINLYLCIDFCLISCFHKNVNARENPHRRY